MLSQKCHLNIASLPQTGLIDLAGNGVEDHDEDNSDNAVKHADSGGFIGVDIKDALLLKRLAKDNLGCDIGKRVSRCL